MALSQRPVSDKEPINAIMSGIVIASSIVIRLQSDILLT